MLINYQFISQITVANYTELYYIMIIQHKNSTKNYFKFFKTLGSLSNNFYYKHH